MKAKFLKEEVNWTLFNIKVNWWLLALCFLGEGVSLWLFIQDAITEKQMLIVNLFLSFLAIQLGCVSILVTFYVKKDVEDANDTS